MVSFERLVRSVGRETKTIKLVGGSVGKESMSNAGDLGSIPGLGRSPGEGHGNPY